MWFDSDAVYPKPKDQLGRWLGPVSDIGFAMTAKILKGNGQVLYQSIFRALNTEELESQEHKWLRDAFAAAITAKIRKPIQDKDLAGLDEYAVTLEYEVYQDDIDGTDHVPDVDVNATTPEDMDNYVGAQVHLPIGERMQHGKVRRRARDPHGNHNSIWTCQQHCHP